MILDTLTNWHLYTDESSPLGRGFRFLQKEFDPNSPDGRIDIEGDRIFALVQGYNTRQPQDCRFEAHRKHIDIQYVYDGAEIMGWAPIGALQVSEPYMDERDVMFFHTPARFSTLEVYKGQFGVFFPGDAHQPSVRLDGYDSVRKVVIKVRVL